jgi:hypothetical protein
MEGSEKVRRYEGSHVCIFDDPENPTRIVLSRNRFIGHIETPGSGSRGDMTFEESAIANTKKQTGLDVYDLELLSDWNNGGKPFREPNGVLQYVRIQNFLARGVEPSDPEEIEQRIGEYRQTDKGRVYQPTFTEICRLNQVEGLAPDVLDLMREHFGYSF